ncbi:MAG: DUF1566 domain-containing protein [Mariprofundaceae bacterium]
MWEVKTVDGLLRDKNHSYTWYDTNAANNGGNAGTANGGTCVDTVNCDTEKYVAAVNAAGICGFNDWRLPTKEELRSIVDYSIAFPGPTVDTAYFPNMGVPVNWFWGNDIISWSSSSYSADALSAWFVSFLGGDLAYNKSINSYVRVVR